MRVITFGESLLRLAPPGFERFFQSPQFAATFGGAEANVAVALASFGMTVSHVTVLPENNPIADAAVIELRRFGVDTSRIVRRKGRLGVYYIEAGINQRPSRVVYDREHSAMACAGPGDIDWDKALEGGSWFHITGITPAISASAADLALEAMRKARERGITVSCDLNYRRSLWNWGKDPAVVMKEMVAMSNIVIANEEHLELLLGFTGPVALKTENILRSFENLHAVAVTTRFTTAWQHGWTAYFRDRNEVAEGRRYEIPHIVDRIGAGDAFAAGLIYGWNCLESHRDALDFALAAGCLKHSISGDFCRLTVDEVNGLRNEGRSGQVER